jgi:hypothetical protein
MSSRGVQGAVIFEELLRNVPGFFILDNTEERFIGTRGTVGGGVQFLVNGISQLPSPQRGLRVPEIARLNIPVESIDRIGLARAPMADADAAPATALHSEAGSGFGLYSVRERLALLQGSLIVQVLTPGARIRIRLPVCCDNSCSE